MTGIGNLWEAFMCFFGTPGLKRVPDLELFSMCPQAIQGNGWSERALQRLREESPFSSCECGEIPGQGGLADQ